ncbi:hypothetical protein GCM10009850_078150 [Nonomuraea monospora]|uniref:YcaO domain-containing protein n=1 Tax=Nonomuraea monospora TaxID=568818 RepID=A0ABN3CSD0_9ACTN
MASVPAGSWSTAGVDEVVDCLGGAVHLAYAEAAGEGGAEVAVIVAGFSGHEARTRARARARAEAMRALCEPAGRTSRSAGGRAAAKELRLDDFVEDPPRSAGGTVPGVGLLTGNRYLLPAEVVWLDRQESGVEPATSGVVGHGVPEAIAEIFAHDVVARWWAGPHRPLLRVSEQLDRLLPPGVMDAAVGLGLRVSAFVLSAQDASVALVTVGGDAGALAVAADRTVKSAVSEAFLLAMASRAQPWHTLPLPDSLRRFAVWHREGDYAAYLEGMAVEADTSLVHELGGLRPASWPEIAAHRFGHEPVAVEPGTPGQVAKVVCPGAACYRATRSATVLPCPIP